MGVVVTWFIAIIPARHRITAALLVLAVIAGASWTAWHRYDAVRDERAKQNEITEERKDDISEGINACADLGWRERLFCTD